MEKKYKSLQEFKTWLEKQDDVKQFLNMAKMPMTESMDYENHKGKYAKPRVSENKLLERIKTDDDPETLVSEFMEDGGLILAINSRKARIEVDSGVFKIPRFCIKIIED